MSQNRRRNNPQDMSVMEQIGKIKEEMCDEYCRYTYMSNSISAERMEKICSDCPLTRL